MLMSVMGWIVLGVVVGLSHAKSLAVANWVRRPTLCPVLSAR
jgi:hypothetical protein